MDLRTLARTGRNCFGGLGLAAMMTLTFGGCGLEKVVEETAKAAVTVVKVIVENPEADKEILEFAARVVVGVAWVLVKVGVDEVAHGSSGYGYVVRPLDSAEQSKPGEPQAQAIWQVPPGGGPPVPLVEDRGIVALAAGSGQLYWISDDGAGNRWVRQMAITQ